MFFLAFYNKVKRTSNINKKYPEKKWASRWCHLKLHRFWEGSCDGNTKARPWKLYELAIGVKIFGHTVQDTTLCTSLKSQTIWNGAKPFKVIDPRNEFFLVQFSTITGNLYALVDGPWTILGPSHGIIIFKHH